MSPYEELEKAERGFSRTVTSATSLVWFLPSVEGD
jgi:hypothetical protein